jgi:methanethiol S-methyltransferase
MSQHTHSPAYGLWPLVIINSAVFIIFAFSFAPPRSSRDWRSFGMFAAFIVVLFTEMYGFPLTIYLLSGWLASRYPGLNLYSHDAGHLWETLFGGKGDPHTNPLHLLSNLLIGSGFILLAASWKVLYEAQRARRLAIEGPYAYVRHPQYVGFIVIMLGFLLQWPTLVTLVMFPILVTMYVQLAKREEQAVRDELGAEYAGPPDPASNIGAVAAGIQVDLPGSVRPRSGGECFVRRVCGAPVCPASQLLRAPLEHCPARVLDREGDLSVADTTAIDPC